MINIFLSVRSNEATFPRTKKTKWFSERPLAWSMIIAPLRGYTPCSLHCLYSVLCSLYELWILFCFCTHPTVYQLLIPSQNSTPACFGRLYILLSRSGCGVNGRDHVESKLQISHIMLYLFTDNNSTQPGSLHSTSSQTKLHERQKESAISLSKKRSTI